jgi:hypothetical protein
MEIRVLSPAAPAPMTGNRWPMTDDRQPMTDDRWPATDDRLTTEDQGFGFKDCSKDGNFLKSNKSFS